MKILLVYNKKTAHKVSSKNLSLVKNLLEKYAIDAEIVRTEYPRHAQEIVRNANFNNYDGIVGAGGDGTLYEIVNGYFQNQSEKRIPIGIIPLGTGNAFSKDMGFEKPDIEQAIRIIQRKQTRKVDVGRFLSQGETRYFINILGFGFVTDVVQTANHFKWLGDMAYTVGVLYRMLMMRTNPMKIVLDGVSHEYDQLLVEISNSRYTGADYLMAPQASIDDGYLDILIAKKMSRKKLLSLFSKIFKGKHLGSPELAVFKAREIQIEVAGTKILSPDGELEGETPIQVSCLHKAIEMFAG